MKKDIHPKYQEVLWVDTATGLKWICGSALSSGDTEKFEGKEYPISKVPISSASHPFFTGSKQMLDAEGRVDKFRKRYAKPAVQEKPAEKEEEPEEKPSKKPAKEKAPAKKATTAKKKADKT